MTSIFTRYLRDQKSSDVRFGSKADIERLGWNVRFVPIAAICTATNDTTSRSPRQREQAATVAPRGSSMDNRAAVMETVRLEFSSCQIQ